MKYYIIAGEASGDMHGANLMRELSTKDPSAEYRFWGGDRMSIFGGVPVMHYRHMAFMGFLEVIMNLRTILGFMKQCKKDIDDFQPDVLVLIDYPGFNMRIAEYAHNKNIKVAYYISPQIWAWKQNRAHKLKRTVDLMLTILPFEKDFYSKFNMDVEYVGHPLIDAIGDKSQWRDQAPEAWKSGKPIVALLPGSRKQEIESMLPLMLNAAKAFPNYRFIVAQAPSQDDSFYDKLIGDSEVERCKESTYPLLANATAALVTSGTATLETALFKVPEVVCYKGNPISYAIARSLVKIKYISLVNLVVNREMVKELIQGDLTSESLQQNLRSLLDPENRKRFAKDYDELEKQLGGSGASARAAQLVYDLAASN
jgi:lipid-A-disaccharide synthase